MEIKSRDVSTILEQRGINIRSGLYINLMTSFRPYRSKSVYESGDAFPRIIVPGMTSNMTARIKQYSNSSENIEPCWWHFSYQNVGLKQLEDLLLLAFEHIVDRNIGLKKLQREVFYIDKTIIKSEEEYIDFMYYLRDFIEHVFLLDEEWIENPTKQLGYTYQEGSNPYSIIGSDYQIKPWLSYNLLITDKVFKRICISLEWDDYMGSILQNDILEPLQKDLLLKINKYIKPALKSFENIKKRTWAHRVPEPSPRVPSVAIQGVLDDQSISFEDRIIAIHDILLDWLKKQNFSNYLEPNPHPTDRSEDGPKFCKSRNAKEWNKGVKLLQEYLTYHSMTIGAYTDMPVDEVLNNSNLFSEINKLKCVDRHRHTEDDLDENIKQVQLIRETLNG